MGFQISKWKFIVGCLLLLLMVCCDSPKATVTTYTPQVSPTSKISSTISTPEPTPTSTDAPTPTPPESVWNVTTLPVNSTSFRSMTVGQDGSFWTAGDIGVVRWDLASGNFQLFNHAIGMPGYSGEQILTDSQGGIWVRWVHPTYKGFGVSHYYTGIWTHSDSSTGLADHIVNDMAAAQDGKVWFATPNGISAYDGSTWTIYTRTDGLPSANVGVITTGPEGVVWAHTSEGVTSFDSWDITGLYQT